MDQTVINEIYDILEAFDAVCERNGLPYLIACGTQLGATRHGGYIPWDVDGDVIILQEDERRFLECAKEWKGLGYELKLAFMRFTDGYKFGCLQLYKQEGSPYAKIDVMSVCPERDNANFLAYSHEGVYDLFPYEKVTVAAWEKVQKESLKIPFGHLMLKGLSETDAEQYLTTLYGETWNSVAASMWIDLSANLLLPETVTVPLTDSLRKPARSFRDPMYNS